MIKLAECTALPRPFAKKTIASETIPKIPAIAQSIPRLKNDCPGFATAVCTWVVVAGVLPAPGVVTGTEAFAIALVTGVVGEGTLPISTTAAGFEKAASVFRGVAISTVFVSAGAGCSSFARTINSPGFGGDCCSGFTIIGAGSWFCALAEPTDVPFVLFVSRGAFAVFSFGAAVTADDTPSFVPEKTNAFGSAIVAAGLCAVVSSCFAPEKISGAAAVEGFAFEAATAVTGVVGGAFVTDFATVFAGCVAGAAARRAQR